MFGSVQGEPEPAVNGVDAAAGDGSRRRCRPRRPRLRLRLLASHHHPQQCRGPLPALRCGLNPHDRRAYKDPTGTALPCIDWLSK